MNEQWIQQLRQKMADYKRPAPEVSWEEIEQALTVHKASVRRRLWLRRIAAAAVVLLIAGVGYWSIQHDGDAPKQPVATSADHQTHGVSGTSHDEEQPAIQMVPTVPAYKMTAALVQEAESVTPVAAEEPDTISIAPTTEQEEPHTDQEREKPTEQPHRIIYPEDLSPKGHAENRLTAKVYVSNGIIDSRRTGTFLQQTAMEEIHDHPESGTSFGISPSSQMTLTDQHVHHRQPIRFGFSLRYQLNDWWSVESGLSYTRLSSDITTKANGVTTVTEQRLNYIGLPLNIGYNVWSGRHFGLYVTTGSMIEKRLDASPWQFSLNAAAGAEYKLTDKFSLYAEPGLGYYFHDGSATPTIYQDRPLNINLSFGLRFDLK